MRRPWAITKRMVVRFYDDQMTQHAAAITYYSLMSLFPVILFGLSILGVVGEYPRTYDAIVRYLNDVAPPSVVRPIDESLRDAFKNKSTASTGLVLSIFLALYGTTGVLESMRRALNVVFGVQQGRSFFRRKAVDIVSTFALLALVLSTLIFVVVGQGPAEDILHLVGADENAAQVWTALRWPAAVLSALLGFSFVYYVTPDHEHRAYHLVTPGAVLGVVAWLVVSWGLSEYISNVVNIGALYGAFTGAIVVVLWLWLSSCSMLLGAELNAAIVRQRALDRAADDGRADREAGPEAEPGSRDEAGPDASGATALGARNGVGPPSAPGPADEPTAVRPQPGPADEPAAVRPQPGPAGEPAAVRPRPDPADEPTAVHPRADRP
jgi:membrane protein